MNNHVRASWRLHFKTVNLPIVVLTLFKPFSCYIVNKLSFKEKIEIHFAPNSHIRKYCEMHATDAASSENCLILDTRPDTQ